MEFLKKNGLLIAKGILPVVIGAFTGYLYYAFIGCNSGSCPITSSPVNSTLYGALFGTVFIPSKSLKVLFSIFKGKKND